MHRYQPFITPEYLIFDIMSILQGSISRTVSWPPELSSNMHFVNTMLRQKDASECHSLARTGEYVARLLRSLLWWLPGPSTSRPFLQIDHSPWPWMNPSDGISDAVHYIYGTERSMIGAPSFRTVVSVLRKASLHVFASKSFAYGVPKAVYESEIRQIHTMILPPPCLTSLGAKDHTRDTNKVDLSSFTGRLPCKAVPIIERTDPELLISKMFPASMTAPGARYVATCFWSWLCVLDGKLCPLSCWLFHISSRTRVALANLEQT